MVIVGANDVPLYEADLSAKSSTDAGGREVRRSPRRSSTCGFDALTPACMLLLQQERPQYLYHFVLHAALDAVEEAEWHSNAMHLGVVDRFNNLQVLCHAFKHLERHPQSGRELAMVHF
jgi:hypothetical protein